VNDVSHSHHRLLQGSRRRDAIELARRGHEVIATARNPETLIDLPATARLSLDVTESESVHGVAEAAGTVDVLVNNAAEIAIGPLESIPFAEVRRLYEIKDHRGRARRRLHPAEVAPG
jgi:NADP-dependent 3-hydroxy acid dehydrogenase YdfG